MWHMQRTQQERDAYGGPLRERRRAEMSSSMWRGKTFGVSRENKDDDLSLIHI